MSNPKQPLLLVYKKFIYLLKGLKGKKRAALIKTLGREHLNCISEIFSNFLKKHLTCKSGIIKKLKNYREEIRAVARKKTSLRRKREILSSKRGGSILAAILPLAAGLLGKLFTG